MTDQQTVSSKKPLSSADLVDHLMQFEGPPEQFLLHLLAVQCHVSTSEAGAIIRGSTQGKPEILSVYPPVKKEDTAPAWLAHSVEMVGKVIAADKVLEIPYRTPDDLYGQQATRYLIMLPIRGSSGVRGAASFLINTSDPDEIKRRRERLELTISLLSLYEMRLTLQRRGKDLKRIRQANKILASMNETKRFKGAAMSLVNEVASSWEASHVSVGFLKGKYCKVVATSHTEKFNRKENFIQDIEAAMEECLDQDVEVLYPTSNEATYICRSTTELAERHAAGNVTIISFPMRREGKPVAVLTLQRPANQPFTIDEVETIRLLCDLVVARLDELHESDRWIGARLALRTRKLGALAVGPTHTWVKLTAIIITIILCLAIFLEGTYKVESGFVFEATEKQIVPTPFDTYLKAVHVEPGDYVKKGHLLAELVTSELELQLAQTLSEYQSYIKQAEISRRENKIAEMRVAQLEAAKSQSSIDLLKYRLTKARIVAPKDGIILTGDLKKQIGAPVKTGDLLFEIAPLDSLRAVLSISENRIPDVEEMQKGELASESHPGDHIPIVITHINPVAELDEQSNVFKVYAELEEGTLLKHTWLRPGMEGLAKIDIDQRPYYQIWTMDLVNWIRMKLWW